MKQVHAEIDIDAPAERVWALLTDFASFPAWNPFIRRATGALQPGTRLNVHLRLLGKRTLTFKPVVTMVEPNRELRWLARFIRPGLFDVDRSFVLRPRADGRPGVRFVQNENCTGLLAPLIFAAGTGKNILRGYEDFNHAIKARAERPARNAPG
ncbi:MAG: SRPBCC family protein [Dehalococcoidia bacterium]